MSTETGTSLTLTRVVAATPEAAFQAWTQPEHMRRWACPEGAMVDDVSVDLTVGGAYRIRMLTPDGTVYTAFGEYRTIEPPDRLVYTWDWEESEHAVGETLVTVTFAALGDATEVVLRHEGFPSAQAREGHQKGWGSCLNQFESLLG